jgi:hypothetical protein
MIMHGIKTKIKKIYGHIYSTTYNAILKCKLQFAFTPSSLDEMFPNPARQRKIE